MALSIAGSSGIFFCSVRGSSITLTYPSGLSEGDLLIAVLHQKPSTANSGTIDLPTDWAGTIASVSGQGAFGTTLGNDTGNTNMSAFYRFVPAGGLTGTVDAALTDTNIAWGVILVVRSTTGHETPVGVAGTDGSPGVTIVAISNASISVAANDLIIGAFGVPTDAVTGYSAYDASKTGSTFGAFTEQFYIETSAGTDIGGFVVTSSVSSSDQAPSTVNLLATAAGTVINARGPSVFIRLRESVSAGAFTLPADAASIALSGSTATLLARREVAANASSLVITGQAATLAKLVAYALDAQATSFSAAGADTNFLRSRSVDAQPGTTAISGQSATLTKVNRYALDAQPAAFTLTGQDATFTADSTLDAQPAAFALTGEDATLTKVNAYALDAQPWAVDLTGEDLTFVRTSVVAAQTAEVALTGQAATFVRTVLVDAQLAFFTLAGEDATLTKVNAYVLDAQPATVSFSGQTSSLFYTQARQLNAQAAVFNAAGSEASLLKVNVYTLSVDAATVAYAGAAATLGPGRILEAQPGAMLGSGLDAATYFNKNTSAQSGLFLVSGQTAELIKISVLELDAQAASYAFAGATSELSTARSLPGDPGALTLSGFNADLPRGLIANASVGGFVLAGQDATLAKLGAFTLQAEAASFTCVGQAAQTQRSKVLRALLGTVAGTGQTAQVRRSRVFGSDALATQVTVQVAQLSKGRVLRVQPGAYASAGALSQLGYDRVILGATGSYGWQMASSQVLVDRQLPTSFGNYATQGQSSTSLITVSFEDANPYNVHISARARHAREARAFCFHTPSRPRVIHEAIQ